MKTNEVYRIFLEQLRDYPIDFDILPLKVKEINMIPRPMMYSSLKSQEVVSSSEMTSIPMKEFGSRFEVPYFMETEMEETFIILSLRQSFFNTLVKPSVDLLQHYNIEKVKSFIAAEIQQQEKAANLTTEITIKGNLAIYGDQ